nr:MAG TPA: hypothetical protein [Crassvirales sp.]
MLNKTINTSIHSSSQSFYYNISISLKYFFCKLLEISF